MAEVPVAEGSTFTNPVFPKNGQMPLLPVIGEERDCIDIELSVRGRFC